MSPDSAPSAPRFSTGRSLVYSAALFLGFFALVEGALRLVGVQAAGVKPRLIIRQMDTDVTLPFIREDPDVFWSPRPGFRGTFRDNPVSINALGLRGPEVALPKPSGRRRVACFGDSITFGYGLGDHETYSHFLAGELAGRGAEVVNAGVTGYTSHQALGLLRRLAPTLQMDVATICIGWNDQNKRPVTDREYERRLRAVTAVEGTLDRLYLYKLMKGVYLRSLVEDVPQTRAAQRVPLGDYRENMEAIVGECRGHGIAPVFVALPRRKKAGEPPFESTYAEAIADLGRTLRVPVIDVGDLGLHSRLDSNEPYFIDLIHMSREGSRLMAQQIARQLEALGLI